MPYGTKRSERDVYSPSGTKYVDSPEHVKTKVSSSGSATATRNTRNKGPNEGAEADAFIDTVIECDGNMKKVAAKLPGKTEDQCRSKWNQVGAPLAQSDWSEKEDTMLTKFVDTGVIWPKVAEKLRETTGSVRLGSQCRDRWTFVSESSASPAIKQVSSAKDSEPEIRKGVPAAVPSESLEESQEANPSKEDSPRGSNSEEAEEDAFAVAQPDAVQEQHPQDVASSSASPAPRQTLNPVDAALEASKGNGAALVWVDGLPHQYQFSPEDLVPFFGAYGDVASVTIHKKGGATVRFLQPFAAEAAAQDLDGVAIPSLKGVLRVRHVLPTIEDEEE